MQTSNLIKITLCGTDNNDRTISIAIPETVQSKEIHLELGNICNQPVQPETVQPVHTSSEQNPKTCVQT